jgi:tRNA G18 (ribose-2'-O)-methylase SpoU
MNASSHEVAIKDIHLKIKEQQQQQQLQQQQQQQQQQPQCIQLHEIRDPHGILELLELRRSRL